MSGNSVFVTQCSNAASPIADLISSHAIVVWSGGRPDTAIAPKDRSCTGGFRAPDDVCCDAVIIVFDRIFGKPHAQSPKLEALG